MVDGRATRWLGHRAQRRSAFVAAALRVIERVGPTATVDQIAGELGLTRQALYRQFDDRADLDAAIANAAADELVAAVLPHLDLTGDLEASVRSGLGAYLDHVQHHLALYRFVRAHEATGAVERARESMRSKLSGVARDRLVAPGPAADVLATGIIGLVDAVVGRWLDEPGGMARDELVDHLVQLVLGVLATVVSP
ncbi:MAG: TetR/AcrR family transcriptional regulator [Mycobacteriales bacterium]